MAIELGILNGYAQEDGSYLFEPVKPATRAEASVIIVRMQKLLWD